MFSEFRPHSDIKSHSVFTSYSDNRTWITFSLYSDTRNHGVFSSHSDKKKLYWVHIQIPEIMLFLVHIQTIDYFKIMTDSVDIHTSKTVTLLHKIRFSDSLFHYHSLVLDYLQNSFLFQMVSSLSHSNLKNEVWYLQTIFRWNSDKILA